MTCPHTPTIRLIERLGLSDDELCEVLAVDPVAILTNDLVHRPELQILLAVTDEAAERVGSGVLRTWLRRRGPGGVPLEHLKARDFQAFEDDLEKLARQGFVLR